MTEIKANQYYIHSTENIGIVGIFQPPKNLSIVVNGFSMKEEIQNVLKNYPSVTEKEKIADELLDVFAVKMGFKQGSVI